MKTIITVLLLTLSMAASADDERDAQLEIASIAMVCGELAISNDNATDAYSFLTIGSTILYSLDWDELRIDTVMQHSAKVVERESAANRIQMQAKCDIALPILQTEVLAAFNGIRDETK